MMFQRIHLLLLGALFFAPVGMLLGACSSDGEDPPATPTYGVIASGIESDWKLIPHRFSELKAMLVPPAGEKGWEMVAQDAGGSFGAIDKPFIAVDYSAFSATGWRVQHGEKLVEIPAGSSSKTVAVEVTGAVAPQTSDEKAVMVLRGFYLSTNQYDTPPTWVDSYDPALGYTSAGFGIRLHDIQESTDSVKFSATVNNRLAPCDRDDATKGDDMNGAIPNAKTWVTVFYSVYTFKDAVYTAGHKEYFVNYEDYSLDGEQTSRPSDAERKLTIKGQAGLPVGFVGLQGFDFISNSATDKDPGCEIKAADECEGTGRYIRTMRARAKDLSYDQTKGEGVVDVDLLFVNEAVDGFNQFEKGGMCVNAQADVVLIQFKDGALLESKRAETAEGFDSDEVEEVPLDLCGRVPTEVSCP
jgi:hypothetical protein